MKSLIITLLAVVTTTQGINLFELALDDWHMFKIAYGKTYSPREELFRMRIYLDNVERIKKHNEEYARGLHSYTLAVNKFSDMPLQEAVAAVNGLRHLPEESMQQCRRQPTFIPPANVQLPDSIDWREKGAVTPVKDQGHCGSCWAFGATGALEGQHFRKTGKLISLSEQNLVDCSGSYGNDGCDGGVIDRAYDYVKDNNGIDTEVSYPYEAKNDTCRFNPKNVGATDVGFIDIQFGSEEDLQAAVATIGPISVAIFADLTEFFHYKSGVFYNDRCSSEPFSLDHAVLVVGYGKDEKSGQKYWLVKNSWGEDWGESGYIKMARNRNNNCGIASMASYPLV
ncbi:cathepsin L-like peptidase [Periplaneta americana]|uniref:cathepsin L-like peptidase n=1 Tax=Periplaneta americana TaxID=6978 RepID=UPI0037E9196B